MKNINKYYNLLDNEAEYGSFEINSNQEYIYSNKQLQPWHTFSKNYIKGRFENALEVGCGNGALIEIIDAKSRYGLELDKFAAERVDKNLVDVRIVNLEDYASDAINHGVFDLVLAFEVVEHFPNPISFVTSCNKLLKSGGMLVGSTPNSKRWWLDVQSREPFDVPPNHFVSFSNKQMKDILIDHGFQILYVNKAFIWQDISHVSYRIKLALGPKLKKYKYLAYGISILAAPIFAVMNLVPNKYLHHGFVAIKI